MQVVVEKEAVQFLALVELVQPLAIALTAFGRAALKLAELELPPPEEPALVLRASMWGQLHASVCLEAAWTPSTSSLLLRPSTNQLLTEAKPKTTDVHNADSHSLDR